MFQIIFNLLLLLPPDQVNQQLSQALLYIHENNWKQASIILNELWILSENREQKKKIAKLIGKSPEQPNESVLLFLWAHDSNALDRGLWAERIADGKVSESRWNAAIDWYSEALRIFPHPLIYMKRAEVFLKLQNLIRYLDDVLTAHQVADKEVKIHIEKRFSAAIKTRLLWMKNKLIRKKVFQNPNFKRIIAEIIASQPTYRVKEIASFLDSEDFKSLLSTYPNDSLFLLAAHYFPSDFFPVNTSYVTDGTLPTLAEAQWRITNNPKSWRKVASKIRRAADSDIKAIDDIIKKIDQLDPSKGIEQWAKMLESVEDMWAGLSPQVQTIFWLGFQNEILNQLNSAKNLIGLTDPVLSKEIKMKERTYK